MKKYGSRKYILSIIQLFLIVVIPIVYHSLGIADELCKIVIAGIAGSSVYHIVNLLDGKLNGSKETDSGS